MVNSNGKTKTLLNRLIFSVFKETKRASYSFLPGHNKAYMMLLLKMGYFDCQLASRLGLKFCSTFEARIFLCH